MSEQDKTDLQVTINKILNGLVALVCVVAIGMGGFALRESYQASLNLRELGVNQSQIERRISQNEKIINDNRSNYVSVKVMEQKLINLESNVTEIKDDIKVLVSRK